MTSRGTTSRRNVSHRSQKKRNRTKVASQRKRTSFGPLYTTRKGRMILGSAEDILTSPSMNRYKGKVQLIFTSPPFPLSSWISPSFLSATKASSPVWKRSWSSPTPPFATAFTRSSGRWATNPGKKILIPCRKTNAGKF